MSDLDLEEKEELFADAWQAMVNYQEWVDRRWPSSARAGTKVLKLKLKLDETMTEWHSIVDELSEIDDPDLEEPVSE